VLRLRHCAVDETTVTDLLGFQRIEGADFSDNESLLGYFMELIPLHWPNLKSLVFRDCTELQEENVVSLVRLLVNGGCPHLRYIDLSCQWSFYHDSLLDGGLKEQLFLARPHVTLREDQCEYAGIFGVDPNAGIDSISVFDEETCNFDDIDDDIGSDDGRTDCDMSADTSPQYQVDRNTFRLGKVFGGSRAGLVASSECSSAVSKV
jgi:hypothetical protein